MPDEYTKDKDEDNHVEENQCKNGTQNCSKEHSNVTDETAAKLKNGKKPLLYYSYTDDYICTVKQTLGLLTYYLHSQASFPK